MSDHEEIISEQTAEEEEEFDVIIRSFAYGHDFGNAEIGGVMLRPSPNQSGVQAISRSIPTAFAKLNAGVMRNMGVDMSNALVVQMEGEQTSYGIGSIALSQSVEPWNGRGDIQRYASRYSLRGVLALSASMIPDKEYRLILVTGLPAETYQKNVALRKDIKNALKGTHRFTIDAGRTWRTCHIEVAAVMMEGAGALVAYGSKDKGARASAVIDIGGRTTDLYVAQSHVPITAFCKGKPVGVETATQMMMENFEMIHGFPLSPLEAREIMHAWVAAQEAQEAQEAAASGTSKPKRGKAAKTPKVYPDISVNGQKIADSEIDKLVIEAITQTADEIVSFVSAAWRQSDSSTAVAARFNPVLGIGGGIYYFGRALKKRIQHLSQPADPVHANARGYAESAQRYLERQEQKAAQV